MPSSMKATWPWRKAAVTSDQLKLTTPGTPYSRFIRAYHSTEPSPAGVSSIALPLSKYLPPQFRNWHGHWVMLAFFRPRAHQPYMFFDGSWSALIAASSSVWSVGGLMPFASRRSLRYAMILTSTKDGMPTILPSTVTSFLPGSGTSFQSHSGLSSFLSAIMSLSGRNQPLLENAIF